MHQEEKIKFNKAELEKYAERSGIKFIVLFGSQAKGGIKEDSDFDIAILTDEEKNIKDLDYYSEILFGLSKILNIPDYKNDLTNLNNADPLLRYEIISGGILLYGDEIKYAVFKSFVLRDYIATSDLRDLGKEMVLKRQKLIAAKLYG